MSILSKFSGCRILPQSTTHKVSRGHYFIAISLPKLIELTLCIMFDSVGCVGVGDRRSCAIGCLGTLFGSPKNTASSTKTTNRKRAKNKKQHAFTKR